MKTKALGIMALTGLMLSSAHAFAMDGRGGQHSKEEHDARRAPAAATVRPSAATVGRHAKLPPGTAQRNGGPSPPWWWTPSHHAARSVSVTWRLRDDPAFTRDTPLEAPPFVLDPRIVSEGADLTMPPVEHEVLRLPRHLDRSGQASRATERQHAAFERLHTELHQLVASPNPLHGPLPDPPQRTTHTALQRVAVTSTNPLHGPHPDPPQRA